MGLIEYLAWFALLIIILVASLIIELIMDLCNGTGTDYMIFPWFLSSFGFSICLTLLLIEKGVI